MIRSNRHRRQVTRIRVLVPNLDQLETRELLSTTASSSIASVAYPLYDLLSLVQNTSPPSGAYTPSKIKSAYGFDQIKFGSVTGDGSGQTIAIVDAYDDPNIQSDLNVFSAQFGIATTTIVKVNQNGGSTLPSVDSTGGWELEIALDVEWAHAIAPGATIMLVEANSATESDLLSAVQYAASHSSVVSMSWGGSEFSTETSFDSYFSKAGVVYVASSGDTGAPASWPSASSNVLTVGGTALTINSSGAYGGESGWSGSGGGPSLYESQPSYQKGVVTQTTTKRATPDVSYDASPSTGFAVYDSNQYNGTSYGWMTVGGTSAGAPQWAALIAIADQGRKLSGQSALNTTSAQQVQTILYANTSAFHDVTSGTSTGTTQYSATTGYDFVTGLGSPYANLVVAALVGNGTTVATKDSLVVSSPTIATAGTSFTITVTAKNSSGSTDASYLGTIVFSSTDVQAGLPASYQFTAADKGTHTFTITLKSAGTQTLSLTDSSSSATSATTSGIVVSAAAASRFTLTSSSSSGTVGTAKTFTLTAYDAFGNVATGFTGTVVLTSTDSLAVLPAGYTFTAGDKGTHTFTVTFKTAGTQSITATSSGSALSATYSSISVVPATPTSLVATTISTSQINLSWTGASGATGYIIQRSSNGTSGWAQIGTTSSGTTSYSDTGLTAGTTYYYRVQATGGNGSGYSSAASSTTTSSATSSTSTSLWSSSFTPYENAYGYGSYELGLQFSSSVSGTVTGVRFYKQTWMSGYTHVGHLWSSTGQLLATAVFTGESSSGWQQVSFSSPVAISANTTYIVSFSTGGGYFGLSTGSLIGSGVTNGSLHANGFSSVYGNAGTMPFYSGMDMNFWVDVAFSPSVTTSVKVSTSSALTVTGITVLNASTGTSSSTTTGQSNSCSGITAAKNATQSTRVVPSKHQVNQSNSTSSGSSKS